MKGEHMCEYLAKRVQVCPECEARGEIVDWVDLADALAEVLVGRVKHREVSG